VATIDAAGEGGAVRRTPQPILARQQSFWLARRGASRFHLQRPHGVHAMSMRPRSCSSYPEEKRPACLTGSALAFSAQRFSRPLDCIRRKRRSIPRGKSHQQSSLPFELHRQRGRSNGDRAFFPTDLEQHSWLYARLAANIFGN